MPAIKTSNNKEATRKPYEARNDAVILAPADFEMAQVGLPPYRWEEDRQAVLRAELDACYAKLYGLTRDELRYILDPKDVYGPDFPGETFRVLKEKEERRYGEYRTRRLVLEAWDRLEGKAQTADESTEAFGQVVIPPQQTDSGERLPEITWIPIVPPVPQTEGAKWQPNTRQVAVVAWLLEHYGNDKTVIPKFKAQKYSYCIERTGEATLDIPFQEFAAGPYAPAMTYRAGDFARQKKYLEVKGNNIVRRRNINEAIRNADKVLVNVVRAKQLIDQLTGFSDDELGGLATVDFAGRKVFEQGEAVTPENIQAYFRSDWPEKAVDPWYTPENIIKAIERLSQLGLFENTTPV